MDIHHLINSGTNLTLSVGAADLHEFADTLIRQAREEAEREITERQKEIYYTPEEVEAIFRVNNSTLWRWSKRGYLIPIKIGGKNRYRKSDIDRILDYGKTPRK